MAGPEDNKKDASLPWGDDSPTAALNGSSSFGPTPPHFDSAHLAPLAQRYELLEQLGQGGMGVVYRARDRETGDVVALKVLLPEIASRVELIERFKAELLLARRVTHKNVCRTHELLRFGETAVIAMEYVEGESLRAFLRRYGSVPLRRGLEWTRQMCSALTEAHAQGVIHRDLKPENVLISRDGTIKVMDFGLACSLETQDARTEGIAGTPAYMSPEQATGKPVDHRTDIYSLGLVLYEMFTCQPAFRADTPVALAMKQVHEQPASPRDMEPYLPPFLGRAIERCLEKEPKDRFQSVAELEATLAEERTQEAAPQEEPVPSPDLAVWRRRDWALLALGALSLLSFLASREGVFPASQMKLQLDAISARRIAAEVGLKLGRPFPERQEAQLESRAARYNRALELWAANPEPGKARAAVHSVWPKELAGWTVRFSSVADDALAAVQEVPERFVTLDHTGRVERFYSSTEVPPAYRPPSIEERRVIAQRAVESVCGVLPGDWRMTESSGGERGALYTATWSPRQASADARVLQVSLLAEKVTDLRCEGHSEGLNIQAELTLVGMRRWLGLFFLGARGLLGAMLMVLFFLGKCYRSPRIWKMLLLSVILGVVLAWLMVPDVAPEDSKTLLNSLPMLSVFVFASVLTVWVGLLTADHYLRRYLPEKVATCDMILRGRWREPILGLSVLRGTLLGLLLLGVQAALLSLGAFLGDTVWTGPQGPGIAHEAMKTACFFFPSFLDAVPVGRALASFSPVAYVVGSSVSLGVVVAVVLIALPLAWCTRKLKVAKRKDPHPKLTLVSSAACVLWYAGFHLQFAAFLPQPFSAFLGLGVFAFLLTWLALRHDVLTIAVAIGTAVFWHLNHPLLILLSDLGNSAQWALCIAWGIFVAAAVVLAFRKELRRGLREATAG